MDIERAEDIMLVNSGAVCEQFVGQHLLFSQNDYQEPELFYWAREKKQSSAEVDYVISEGSQIVPVEVKAGKGGALKSLHLFVREKNCLIGLRFNSERLSVLDVTTSISTGKNVTFQLVSLPLYLIGQTRRIIRDVT